MTLNHHHLIDSWIAELALPVRAERRVARARAAAVAGSAEPVLAIPGGSAEVRVSRRNFTEPRLVSRGRGDRPSVARRPVAARRDDAGLCLGLA